MYMDTLCVFILYRLLPLAFSSIKDISLLQNLSSSTRGSTPTNTTMTAVTNTTSTKTDSLQPPPSTTNGSLISTELRTPTSPTSSTLSGASELKHSTTDRDGSSQQQEPATVHAPQISDAKRAALLRRRHTIFVAHDLKDKATAMEVEQDLDDEEEEKNGKFQGAETKAKKRDDSVRLTQSMPHIVDDSADTDTVVDGSSDRDRRIPSLSKSVEYKRVMEEVKGQREQLLAFHNRQREEDLLEGELAKEERLGEGEHDGSTVEEIQTMEGMAA